MSGTCGDCRWWGNPTDPPAPEANEHRLCNYPVPLWQQKMWASPPHLSGCLTHTPKEPTP